MIITIANQQGGVGKSMLAVNLLIMLQQYLREPINIIDMDMQRSATFFNKLRIENGYPGINILQATLVDMIEIAKKERGHTIIDVGGGFDVNINRAAIAAADVVITPVLDSEIDLYGLQNFWSDVIVEVRKIKPNIKVTVLLNRARRTGSKSFAEIFEYASAKEEFDIFKTVLQNRSEFRKSFQLGQSIEEFAPRSIAAEEMRQLVKELILGKKEK